MTTRRALHGALWAYDDAYWASWFVGPQALALIIVGAAFWFSPGISRNPIQPDAAWVKAPPAPVEWGACQTNGISPDAAIPACSALITSGRLSNQDLAQAFFVRGYAHGSKMSHNLAISDYSESLRLVPRMSMVLNNRGNLYSAQRNYPQAEADFSAAIEASPNLALPYANRADT